MNVLETHNISKTFQEGREQVNVLNGVSLELRAGEIVALEGPSGSGKTTYLSIVGCILTPSAGRVIVDGEEVDAKKPARLPEIRKKSIGFVFQQYNLFPSLTALENVQYALKIKGKTGSAARKEAEQALESVDLTDRKDFLPRDLSGGQKQRVALARALAGAPPLLLADEPTANLDTQLGTQIIELFRQSAKRDNRGVLIVTHDPKVRTIADRVLQILDGRILQ
jgi:putative ABC transport system ATP-binding protein